MYSALFVYNLMWKITMLSDILKMCKLSKLRFLEKYSISVLVLDKLSDWKQYPTW